MSSERGDLAELVASMYSRSESELKDQAEQIHQARQKVIIQEEERKAAAAAKKKPGAKPKKDEEPKEEEKPQGPPPKRELDLSNPQDFAEALKEQIPRPFVFGPIEFSELDNPELHMGEHWGDHVCEALESCLSMPPNLCEHGYQVTCKGKTLKRATTLVKHSRFLRNLIVKPTYPVPVQHSGSPAQETSPGATIEEADAGDN